MNEADIKKELFEKFKEIGYLDPTTLIKELNPLETISEKLDHLKEVKHKYYDKCVTIIHNLSKEEREIFKPNYKIFWKLVFGDDELITGLYIQKSVYDAHIKNEKRTPEYGQWFLHFYASEKFEHYINDASFKLKINSKLKDTFIKAELKQINNIEEKAKKLVLEKTIYPYQIHRANWDYTKEVETIRVLSGNYYKKNPMLSEGATSPVMAYFRHILFKPYLESLLTINEEKIKTNTKLAHKWYALFYWIKLNAYGDLPPTTSEGEFNKKEIQLIGKTLIEDFEKDINTTTTGQGFYTQFGRIKDDLNNKKLLDNNFPNWKRFIKKLSKNDKTIIKYIKEKYPS